MTGKVLDVGKLLGWPPGKSLEPDKNMPQLSNYCNISYSNLGRCIYVIMCSHIYVFM